MSIKKPIKLPSEQDIEKLISKGAPVNADKDNHQEFTHLNLRIRKDILAKVNDSVSKRVGIKRNGWILEAIHEKLNNKDNL